MSKVWRRTLQKQKFTGKKKVAVNIEEKKGYFMLQKTDFKSKLENSI